MWGFMLMGKGKVWEFYVDDIKERDNWVKAMMKFTVHLDIHNEYKISQEIGSGNFARVNVCIAKNDMTSKFALKTIYKDNIKSSKRSINQLLCEIEVLRKLDHPHVVPIYEVFESSKYIHILQELLEGGELFDRISSKGNYKESDAQPVMY